MDVVLRPHLEAVTNSFKTNEFMWRSQIDSIRNMEINDARNPNSLAAQRSALDRQAGKLREEGNAFFKALDFPKARLLYTHSIAAAIGGPLGALAYFNRYRNEFKLIFLPRINISHIRSAALFQMKFYKDCIKDIDRALVLGYPKSQQLYSLHLRKAKCLKFLGKDFSDCLDETMKVGQQTII
jgi:hypothetical protein